MALARALEPELVLCSACLESEDHESRWMPLRSGDDALLVREVCVRPRCLELQVRGHFCVAHVLEFELAWQQHYAVRACHGCRISTLQLYDEKREIWFILGASEPNRNARGVEKRWKKPTTASQASSSPERSRSADAKRPLGKRQRRRSIRFRKQHMQREQVLAWEWSLGNVSHEKVKYLWRDNQKRLEAEKNPAAYAVAMKLPVKKPPSPNARPEPLEIFCTERGCQRYAKTGDRCRFHSSTPLVFVQSQSTSDPTAAPIASTK